MSRATAPPTAGERATVARVTRELAAAGCVSAAAEARWLVEEAADPRALRAMVARRVAGEPLQYVVGWAPFGRLRLLVGAGVFVPRPETEGLADRAATRLRAAGPSPVAVDLCTGSGAIACFLAAEVPGARVLATELDPAALAWARLNTERLPTLRGPSHRGTPGGSPGPPRPPGFPGPLRVELLAGDLDAPLPGELAGQVDVLCANVPYVPSGAIPTLPRDVRDHEPRLALDGGPDGLDVLRRVAARAGHWLAPGGFLLCEIGEDQGEAAAALLAGAGLVEITVLPDMAGGDRVVEGRRGPGNPKGVPR